MVISVKSQLTASSDAYVAKRVAYVEWRRRRSRRSVIHSSPQSVATSRRLTRGANRSYVRSDERWQRFRTRVWVSTGCETSTTRSISWFERSLTRSVASWSPTGTIMRSTRPSRRTSTTTSPMSPCKLKHE